MQQERVQWRPTLSLTFGFRYLATSRVGAALDAVKWQMRRLITTRVVEKPLPAVSVASDLSEFATTFNMAIILAKNFQVFTPSKQHRCCHERTTPLEKCWCAPRFVRVFCTSMFRESIPFRAWVEVTCGRGGSSRRAAALPEKCKIKDSAKRPKLALSLDLATKPSQHNHFRYFRHHFGSTFRRNPTKPMFRCLQRHHLCDDVYSTLADEFGDFGAVIRTALKERNQTIGCKKHGGISAYRKAFLIFWRWVFKEKTEEIWSWLFLTSWISCILNFIIKFNNAFASTLAILIQIWSPISGCEKTALRLSAPVQLGTVG